MVHTVLHIILPVLDHEWSGTVVCLSVDYTILGAEYHEESSLACPPFGAGDSLLQVNNDLFLSLQIKRR
jgi:hypothetical protein